MTPQALLSSYPGPVTLVTIQYPVPHVRRERHVVTDHLVRSLAALMPPGGEPGPDTAVITALYT